MSASYNRLLPQRLALLFAIYLVPLDLPSLIFPLALIRFDGQAASGPGGANLSYPNPPVFIAYTPLALS